MAYLLARAINGTRFNKHQSTQQLEVRPDKQMCAFEMCFYLIQPLNLLHIWEIYLKEREEKQS